MAQESSSTSELTIDVTCTPRNRANLRRLKTSSIQSFQRWEKENELLYAMIEDESAWLSSLFADAIITPEVFFYALEDGTILCLLANFIQEMAENYGTRTGKSVPGKKFTFHKSKKGARQSMLFHSRENVDKFLTWCRWHGIPEAILFESNDAVLVDECRTGGREIVICLMEIARRSSQYEIEVPQMIKLEREIEEEELSDNRGCAEEQQALPLETNLNTETRGDRSPIDSDSGVESVFEEGDPASPRISEFVADETKIVQKCESINKFEVEVEKKPQRGIEKEESHSLLESSQPKTELDKKVCKIAQEYNIKIVHRLKEGKYIILGKAMFVRMLNDHLLVRIGGGWDTLDHYVMTHAPKPIASDEITATPQSSERKSSGVWTKLVDKVKRRESQPNLTESPVVISKRERPDSSPSVYRLRDRVRKKLSVTEKDEKDISDAIRKIETSLTVKSSHSSSFTSKTFFQLKNRFDRGRKSSREYILNNKERKKMTDQTIETISGEQQKEMETKEEESGPTLLLEFETSQGTTEATSTTDVTEFSTNELSSQKQAEESFPSTDDFDLFGHQAQLSSGQSFPISDPNDLLFNDNPPLFSSDTLQPEQARDEIQAEIHEDEGEESRVEIPSSPDHEAPKSAMDFGEEIEQEIESKPTEFSDEPQETAPAPPTFVPDDNDPKPHIEEQMENILQESPEVDQADIGEVAGDSDLIKVSYESEEVESAPQGNDLPELYQGEQQQEVNDYPQISFEQTEAISDKTKQEDDALPAQFTSHNVTSLNSEVEITTEEEKLEDVDRPTQMIWEDRQSFENAMKDVSPDTDKEKDDEAQVTEIAAPDVVKIEDMEDVSPDTDKEKDDEAQVTEIAAPDVVKIEDMVDVSPDTYKEKENEAQVTEIAAPDVVKIEDMEAVSPDTDKEKDDEAQVPEIAVPGAVKIDQGEEPEYYEHPVPGADVLMPVQLDNDAVSKGQEEPEESEYPAQITDEISQDKTFEQEKSPEIVSVVESEKTVQEDEQLATIVDLGEEARKDKSVGIPVGESETMPLAEEPKAEQDKIEQKEAHSILPDTSSAPVNHTKTTKKVPGTTKKEHVKSGNSSTSKNLSGRKKEDQKAERPKESATKPSHTRTTKTTSTTTAPRTKTVPGATGARSTSATKRPASAQTHKTGIGASKVDATKTTPKTTLKSSASGRPPSSTTTRPTSVKDKKTPASGVNHKSKPMESRPRSAVSTKSTDKKDGKAEAPSRAPSRPLSAAKTKPLPGTTKTTVKKTTTTTTKTTSAGPTRKSEVSKTTVTATDGGTTSKTKTTVKKSTETGGLKTKSSIEKAPHHTSSVRNNTSEMKSGARGKPGSATTKSKPSSATTRGKPGTTMAKGKSTSERPKSPTKGTAKKSAPKKEETTVSAPPAASEPNAVTEPPTSLSPQQEASDLATPGVTADSKEVTSVIQRTEVIEDDGETKVLQTKEVTETVFENGEYQTITKETVVEESG